MTRLIKTNDVVFPEKYYVENFLEIFQGGKISVAYFYILLYYIHKSNMTVTSNRDRSRTVTTLIAPTVDISPVKAVLTTQQCRQNVIRIKLTA